MGVSEVGVDPTLVNADKTHKEDLRMTVNEEVVTDPVCQMKIRPADAVATLENGGTTYYFCSQDCADSFKESPEDYI